MTVFYVDSTEGSDANPGTRGMPWQSLAKIKAGIASGRVGRGDRVRLRRSRQWFGSLDGFGTAAPYGPHLVVESYGVGAAPLILGYKVLNTPSSWTEHSAGVWTIDLTKDASTYSGNTSNDSANVGFLLVDGAMWGQSRAELAELTGDWDFYGDETAKRLYVKSAGNPASRTVDLRAAPRATGVTAATSVSVLGVDFEGFGGHGWRADGTVGDFTVRGCSFRKIGGSTLASGSRYGNGGEAWIGSYDITDEHNRYEDVYDVGSTEQGTVESGKTSFRDIVHRFNTYVNCNQSYELWAQGSAPSGGFRNVKFQHNLCINSGLSWGSAVRPDTAGKGNHLMTYDMTLPTDVEVNGNVFVGVKDTYRYHRRRNPDMSFNYSPPPGFVSHDNVVVLDSGTSLSFDADQQVEAFELWRAEFDTEHGTQFLVTPRDVVEEMEADSDGNVLDALTFLSAHTAAAKAVADVGSEAQALLSVEYPVPESTRSLTTGFWYAPRRGTPSTATMSASFQARGPVWVAPGSGRVDSVAFEVTTAGSVGSIVRVALCRLLSADRFELIQDLGVVGTTSTGIIQVAASARVQQGEHVWVALVHQGSAAAPQLRTSTGLNDPTVGSSNLPYVFGSSVNGAALSGVIGSFPNGSASVLGQTTEAPVVAVRAS